MALARAAAGDVVAALTLLEVTLHDAEQAHGARNQHTIALRANVADCLAALGRGDEAVAVYRRAVDDSAALLGANHPDTVALHEEMTNVVQDAEPRKAVSSSDSISVKRVEVISST
jgi:hypothetical protein